MAGASPAAVRRILRHSDQKMTDIYSHLAPEFLRAEVDRLTFQPRSTELTNEAGQATGTGDAHPESERSVPNRPQGSTEGKEEAPDSGRFLEGNQGLLVERRKGFEPSQADNLNGWWHTPFCHSPLAGGVRVHDPLP